MRREDWPERLAAYLEARNAHAFAFGAHDCALFAADWILEATGVDPIAELRGSWVDEVSALRVLREHGSLLDLATHCLGAAIDPRLASRGDVVLTDITGREGLAVCVGDTFAAPSERGVVTLPMQYALLAWSF